MREFPQFPHNIKALHRKAKTKQALLERQLKIEKSKLEKAVQQTIEGERQARNILGELGNYLSTPSQPVSIFEKHTLFKTKLPSSERLELRKLARKQVDLENVVEARTQQLRQEEKLEDNANAASLSSTKPATRKKLF